MLEVQQLTLAIGSRVLVEQLSFSVQNNQIAGIQAPSGSGKSLLLRWILGALPPEITTSGTLRLNGLELNNTPTERRKIGLMLQSAKLFPHLSVAGNLSIAIPSTVKGNDRKDLIRERLSQAKLEGYEERDPSTLSGGEQARVALLRSLLAHPNAILLDEPFSSLDVATRDEFRAWVYAHIKDLGIPALIVSHDRRDLAGIDCLIDIHNDTMTLTDKESH